MDSLNLTPEENNQAQNNYAVAAQAKSGASWFYWIAGLSLVNSAIFLFGGNWSFFAGLGATQVVDGIVDGILGNGGFSVIKLIAFAVDIVIAAIFVGCGVFANKFQIWAFVAGMVLYFLDGLLLLVLGAYLPAAFHVFALYMIYKGLAASKQLNTVANTAL